MGQSACELDAAQRLLLTREARCSSIKRGSDWLFSPKWSTANAPLASSPPVSFFNLHGMAGGSQIGAARYDGGHQLRRV